MEDLPDYRSEKMVSPEGWRNAASRREAWASTLSESDYGVDQAGRSYRPDDPDVVRRAEVTVKEFSELTGFWLSWHMFGGFERLIEGGWNRATVFRKMRRFRAIFGSHPDEYKFPWIHLELEDAWRASLDEMLFGPDLDRRPRAYPDLDIDPDADVGDQ